MARKQLGAAPSGVTDAATKAYVDALMLVIYPVGSIYINTSDTNPGTFLGGTWAAFGAGRVPVGFSSGETEFDADEETGGAKTVTLTEAQIPSHTHPLGLLTIQDTGSGSVVFVDGTNSATRATGGGGAHNNLQPYIVVRMWKRTA